MESNMFHREVTEQHVYMCLSSCSYLCSRCRDRGRSTFPPPLPGGWSRRAACGTTRSYRSVEMESDAFHEDGSSGGQRQTALPWKFTQVKRRTFTTDNWRSLLWEQSWVNVTNKQISQTVRLLFILPEFLDPEDVEFVSVDVGQEPVRLSEGRALGCTPAVPHQINAVACTQETQARYGCPRPRLPGRYFTALLEC